MTFRGRTVASPPHACIDREEGIGYRGGEGGPAPMIPPDWLPAINLALIILGALIAVLKYLLGRSK